MGGPDMLVARRWAKGGRDIAYLRATGVLGSCPHIIGHSLGQRAIPSVVFLMLPGPSVRFRVFFFGWQVRMSVIRTAEIPKIGKIGAKIRASVC